MTRIENEKTDVSTLKDTQAVSKCPDFLQTNQLPEIPEKEFPFKKKPDIRIHFEKPVFDEIWSYAEENVAVELAGLLVGRVMKDFSGAYLLVENFYRLTACRNEGVQIVFPHDLFKSFEEDLNSKFPGKKILGWSVSHPGMGPYPTKEDEAIHRKHFSLPFQVIFIVDPNNGEEGLFAWVEGKLKSLSECWVGNEIHEVVSFFDSEEESLSATDHSFQAEERKNRNRSAIAEYHPVSSEFYKYLFVVIAFFAGMGLTAFYLREEFRLAFRETARAEIREILFQLGSSVARLNELVALNKSFVQLEEILASFSVENPNLPSTFVRQIKEKTAEGRALIVELASATSYREQKLNYFISGKYADGGTTVEKIERLRDDLAKLRSGLGWSYYIQIKILMAGIDTRASDTSQLETVKQIMNLALAVAPTMEKQFRSEFPMLFPSQAR